MPDTTINSMAQLSEVIRKEMEASELNIIQLAALSCVSRKFLGELLQQKDSVRIHKVLNVTNALGINLYPFTTEHDAGKVFSQTRERLGLDQVLAASLSNVSASFLSDIENNKPTLHTGKVLQVIRNLNLHGPENV